MPVTWLEADLTDLLEIRALIAEHNPTAANAVGDRIASFVERLEAMPLSGRVGRVARTRELVVPGCPTSSRMLCTRTRSSSSPCAMRRACGLSASDGSALHERTRLQALLLACTVGVTPNVTPAKTKA